MFRVNVIFYASVSAEDISAAFKVLGFNYKPSVPASAATETVTSFANILDKKRSRPNRLGRYSTESRKPTRNDVKPTLEQVRRQYRELARLHHPDLGGGDDSRMKVINTAYELIQSSGVLQLPIATVNTESADTISSERGSASSSSSFSKQQKWKQEYEAGKRFAQRAGTRRRRVPDDFTNGDDSSWVMKSALDWQSFINSTDGLTPEEMRNPANHPFTHSKFFTFENDTTIYRMLRGGATIPQVGRTLSKPATFIEKRIHNAQFKARVQYLLRAEKRQRASSSLSSSLLSKKTGARPSGAMHGDVITPATPRGPNHAERLLRTSPFEDEENSSSNYARRPTEDYNKEYEQQHQQQQHYAEMPSEQFAQQEHVRTSKGNSYNMNKLGRTTLNGVKRKKEWEVTFPPWRAPEYFNAMSMEEKARYADSLPSDERMSMQANGYQDSGAHLEQRGGWVHQPGSSSTAASKMSRSYANFARIQPTRRTYEK